MLNVGDRIEVRTPDRRSYFGYLLELREGPENTRAVVRLDTGWVTSYPVRLVHPVEDDSTPLASDGAAL